MKRLAIIVSMVTVLALGLLAGIPQFRDSVITAYFSMAGKSAEMAQGYVFEDKNRNGKRDPGEPGLAGVRVSDQSSIVKTDRNGRWELPVADDVIYYVVKPRGWMTPVSEHKLPRFYYIHKPNGSPKSKYAGVAPTGPLPASIDFPLHRQEEPKKFETLFFGDTQPRDLREVEYIAHDVVEPIVGQTKAKFGVTLGDIAFDDLNTFEPLNGVIAMIGIPWYNVLGNHDMNYDSPNDVHSDETFERVYGPSYYSFEYGPVHFVVLDDVVWTGPVGEQRGSYKAGLGEKQLAWLRKDLELIPKNQLVVLGMHIPMTEISDRQELYRILETRPFALSVSAHTHYQEHRMIDSKDGWEGEKPHHHVVNVTACGSWWQGAPDEYGIPHTTMRCGAPNGYAIFTFDGNQYSIQFRAARRPVTEQMSIYAPESVKFADAPGTTVNVNVYGADGLAKVEMRVGDVGHWITMQKVDKPDPEFVKVSARDKTLQRPYRALPDPIVSPHLWESKLPTGLSRGVHPIHIKSKDRFGQVYLAQRSIRIE